MPTPSFQAMVVEEISDGSFTRQIKSRKITDLPKGEVLIKVHYSSLNYKDALSATGNKGVTRKYPHTPGIDAAGIVESSTDPAVKTGDPVIVTGYDLGMNTSGGFGQYVSVPAGWVVRLPSNLTLVQSMILGTAGFTAGLGLLKLTQAGVKPESGDILVTGASGGVGSIAVALLAHCGYSVVAASGKPEAREMLSILGAKEIVGRENAHDNSGKPLLKQRWAGVIETVGGEVLSYALRSTARHGVVACCGNVASANLRMTVYPFILRGIALFGIDSATTEMKTRQALWQRLASQWKIEAMEDFSSVIGLDDLNVHIDKILSGQQMGRRVIDLNK